MPPSFLPALPQTHTYDTAVAELSAQRGNWATQAAEPAVVAERIGPAARPEPDIEVPAEGYTRQLCSDGQARSWEDAGVEGQEVRERQRKDGLEAEQASCCAGIEKSHAEVAIEEVGRTEVHLLAVVVMPEVDQVGPMGRTEVADLMVVDTGYMVVRPSARMRAVV